jgi:RNA polymerase sigma-70 factor (ECF subfamily)
MTAEPPAGKPRSDLTPSLVGKLRAGDAEAGSLLDALYRQPILRFCWGYVENMDEAEDAVQEVFCKALKATEVPDNFRAWLYRIARNHCLNVLRARARRHDRQAPPADSQLPAGQTGNLTRLVKHELQSRIVHLLSALPVAQKEVLRLRYAEDLSRAEIAYVLESPESVVKSRLFEGLKKLREHTSLLDESGPQHPA